jgi:hypothetical protein
MPDPTKNPFFDAYPGLGGASGASRTPPFRLPGMEAGPSPPVGMPEMSEAEALKSEQGYFGPPVGRDIDLSQPQGSEPGAMEQRRVSPGPRGKVFIDRIEDDGTAVLIGADGETATTMKAQKGWKEGMYVDPPVRTRKRRAVP